MIFIFNGKLSFQQDVAYELHWTLMVQMLFLWYSFFCLTNEKNVTTFLGYISKNKINFLNYIQISQVEFHQCYIILLKCPLQSPLVVFRCLQLIIAEILNQL
jgi:hypothetical protein